MPTPIPAPVAADNTGLPDSQWISAVRDALEDYPKYTIESWTADGTNGVVGANASPLTVAKPPVNDGSLTVRDSTAGTNYTVITSGTPSGTNVLANLNTGELQFATAPTASDVIQVSYQSCKWRDQKILDALYAGLRAMFPLVGKVNTDTSVNIQVNTWDYTLPMWCQDPRSRVYNIEVRDPGIPIEPYRQLSGGYHRVDLTTVHIPRAQMYSPTANLRIIGWGPYLALGDLEPQLFGLPVLYALSMLLPKKETFRIRQDTAVPLTLEGGQQAGLLVQTGDYFLRRFEIELERLGKTPGPGSNRRIRTTYEYDRHR